MHPIVLSELAEHLSLPLSIILKNSLQTTSMPKDWKEGQISAIFKKGNKTTASNYRPVSLTSVVCKCFENITRKHITDFFKLNDLICDRQYGFIKGRSTTLQLIHALDNWTSATDRGQYIDIIYMDFLKAFDKVPHKRLIGKLHSYGINTQIVNWLEVFLSNRKQKVAQCNFRNPSGISHWPTAIHHLYK